MGRLVCPACGQPVPDAPIVAGLSVCPNPACLASLVLEGVQYRRATGADTTVLSDRELTALRQARKRYRG